MDNSKEIDSLETFLLDNPELERLESLLSQFNVFETLKMVNTEVRHSNFLAWLLNPSENHSLGDYFLKQFLKHFVVENKSSLDKGISIFDLEMLTYSNVEVRREWRSIDVLVVIDDPSFKLVIAIENKIKTGEHSDQLTRYRQTIQHEFQNYQKLFIFLSPENLQPTDQAWNSYSYTTIALLLESILRQREASLNENIVEFIRQYITLIRRYFVGNSEIEKICKQIYSRHSAALDLIFQYKPDLTLEISEFIQEKIRQNPSLIMERPGKVYITFTVKVFESLLDNVSEGWLKSKRILAFEFSNSINSLSLSLYIGPGPSEYRERLLNFCKKEQHIFRKSDRKLGKKWHAVYSKKFLDNKDFEESMGSPFEEIATKIEKKWDDSFQMTLPK